jgi:tetratricopeptide (TPR) repeat protein
MASDAVTAVEPTAAEQQQLLEAGRKIARGFFREAQDILTSMIVANPGLAEAHRYLGAARMGRGDVAGAEAAWREALRLAPGNVRAAVALADLLGQTARHEAALALIEPMARAPGAGIESLSAYAVALKALGRLDESLSAYEQARAVAPGNAVAEHNVAGLLGDLQRFAESRMAAERAFGKGLNAPETWLIHARALQGLGELEAAERSYRQAVALRPAYADAHLDLAQLIWMRSGDLCGASQALDGALARYPGFVDLHLAKAKLLDYAGDAQAAYAALMAAPQAARANGSWLVRAAQLASDLDPPSGLALAARAIAVRPNDALAVTTLVQAQLAAGQPESAADTALAARDRWPDDQHIIAVLAAAWRLLDDPRYRGLYDYDAFVSVRTIDTPPGWRSLGDFLGALAAHLRQLHRYRQHPLGQSLRNGSQTEQSLRLSSDPLVKDFFTAIDAPIRDHIRGLGPGADPVRRRATGRYGFAGAWSVRLNPKGFHVDHVHQRGWLSSACYIDLPKAVERGREGWLKFGEPGVATTPTLGPEHFIKPALGRLVLFPSYMWHGTVPFGGDADRLSIAFDLVPA